MKTPWTHLHSVEGAGTTAEVRSYRFTDRNLPYEAEALTYRLKQIDTDGSASFSDPVTVEIGAPKRLALHAPFPNPSRAQVTLRYALPEASPVTVRVYNVLGQQVATLVDRQQDAERKEIVLNTQRLSSGVYFVRMRAGNTVRTQKVTVVR